MMRRLKGKALAILLGCMVSLYASAEGGCPKGQVPQQGNGWRACVPVGGSTSADGPSKQEVIYYEVNAYGAVAFSSDFSYAMRNGYSSEAAAKAAALDGCIRGGGVKCETSAWYRNSCAAVAYADKGLIAGTGRSETAAKERALNKCRNLGGAGCKIAQVGCSRPGM